MKTVCTFVCLYVASIAGFSQSHPSTFKQVKRSTTSSSKSFNYISQGSGHQQMKTTRGARQKIDTMIIDAPDSSLVIHCGGPMGLPNFIEREKPALKSFASDTARCYDFLKSVRSKMGVAHPRDEFSITRVARDDSGNIHMRMNQHYKGIRVDGSDVYVHLKKNKEQFTGNYHVVQAGVDTVATLSKDEALAIVMLDLQGRTTCTTLDDRQKKFLHYTGPTVELVFKQRDGSRHMLALAYKVSVRPNLIQEWLYWVDAITGAIMEWRDNTAYESPAIATAKDLNGVLQTINTGLDAGTYYLVDASQPMFSMDKDEGYIATYDAQNTSTKNFKYVPITSVDNTWDNPTAVSTHHNTTQTYKYLLNTFKRNSINDMGGSIYSFVNVASDTNGTSMQNAFWNGQFACYGNGGYYFKPLAGALDVVAHELGHGVIGNTANLEYKDQSGAINESFADIFGSMVDRDDWAIGEDITNETYSPNKRMRDMQDPHMGGTSADNYWQPRHMSEIYIGTDDHGGVHTNSGIGNYAFYLFATAVSKNKAEQVYYKALTNYLTSTSQFSDLRIAVVQSASDLYGAQSGEVKAAAAAFDSVGIYDMVGHGDSLAYDFPVNPGEQQLCYYNLDSTLPHTFYTMTMNDNPSTGITKTRAWSKMSITDDGGMGVFVAEDKTIRAINLTTKQEFLLQADTIWSNVVVSKNGSLLAAVTSEQDTAVWVYNIASSTWKKFHLYNPTTSNDNLDAGGVLYSDALDFDLTGQSIIYDAYNEVKSSSHTTPISYWDIGIINVWDDATNTFANGEIMKLFGSLPSGISIGNPTFSKNSNNVIAFDYFEDNGANYSIIGANIETGNLDEIVTNTSLGFPSFSKDDSLLVFTSQTLDSSSIYSVRLRPNKISPRSTPKQLLTKAIMGVCYASGKRSLGIPPVAVFSSSHRTAKSPATLRFFDNSDNQPTSWAWNFEGGTPASSTSKNPSVTYSKPGTYSVRLIVSNKFGKDTIESSGLITITGDTTAVTFSRIHATGVSISPNPASTYLDVRGTDGVASYHIVDALGQVVARGSTVGGRVDIRGLKPGFFSIQVTGETAVEVHQFIKQ